MSGEDSSRLPPGRKYVRAVGPRLRLLLEAGLRRTIQDARDPTVLTVLFEDLAALFGLVVERIGYFNTLLFPLAVAARLADRALRRTRSIGMAQPSPPVNQVLQAVFAIEAQLIARRFFPFGTSVIAVLTPNRQEVPA